MRFLAAWLTVLLAFVLPTQVVAKERWTAGYYAGGVYSEVDGSGGTNLAIYCNPWISAHPAGLLITLPATVTDAEDKTYEIVFSFAEGEVKLVMLLTQGRALQISAKETENFHKLEELVARIKASGGFSASAKELDWSDNFSSENAGPAIGDRLECTHPLPD